MSQLHSSGAVEENVEEKAVSVIDIVRVAGQR